MFLSEDQGKYVGNNQQQKRRAIPGRSCPVCRWTSRGSVSLVRRQCKCSVSLSGTGSSPASPPWTECIKTQPSAYSSAVPSLAGASFVAPLVAHWHHFISSISLLRVSCRWPPQNPLLPPTPGRPRTHQSAPAPVSACSFTYPLAGFHL